jgi:hypothetical protein
MADTWVYLDTSVLIHMEHALTGEWIPEPDPEGTDRLWLAAARLRFYGYSDHNGWYLVTSGEARRELTVKTNYDWSVGQFLDIDELGDRPYEDDIAGVASDLVQVIGLKPTDARHLARALLYEPIGVFLTADVRTILRRVRNAVDDDRWHPPERLRLLSSLEAQPELKMVPGKSSPIMPSAGNPLADMEPWWIPTRTTEDDGESTPEGDG